MNRPLNVRAPRNAAAPNQSAGPKPSAESSWVRDSRWAPVTGFMVWLLVAYLSVTSPFYFSSGGEDAQTVVEASSEASADPVARAVKLGLLVLSLGLVLWRAKLAWLVARQLNPFFLAFLALVPFSVLWSIEPTATTARFVSILSIVLVSMAFTLTGWHRARFQNVVRPILTLILIGSLIAGIVAPGIAIETGDGPLKNAWRGLLSQKNQLGMMASFGLILWLHAWINREVRWWKALLGAAVSGACVLLSRSSTALLATTLTTLFLGLIMVAPANLRRYMPYMVSAFALLVVVYALAVLNIIPGFSVLLEPIAAMTGKDLTFSSRDQIWAIIKEHIEYSPFLGTGYGAYWIGAFQSSPSYAFVTRLYYYPTQSHNGYLEITNDLGLVGLVCLLGYLLYWVRQSLRLMTHDRRQATLFLALFFQQAITNLSESTWLAINSSFAFVVCTLATCSLARALLEQRLKRFYG